VFHLYFSVTLHFFSFDENISNSFDFLLREFHSSRHTTPSCFTQNFTFTAFVLLTSLCSLTQLPLYRD
jgi:hypothetical protein